MHELAGKANERQVGGQHYKVAPGLPEHWDLAIMYGWDPFQYQITKYVMRWRDKKGLEDLEKAAHFLEKYIEAVKTGYRTKTLLATPEFNPPDEDAKLFGPQSGSGGVKQTGYVDFTYEGGTTQFDLFTCRHCKMEVRPPPNESPYKWHTCDKLLEGDIAGGVAG